ncbi:DUF3316 domain-containing protein [Porphyromonas pogonae]|uniref:DUF3316 domain-containing protein n=1 Tax=Porphyromonas pogonae TaxID=867595 RepID=UPI002E76F551|nr:DUF3316 domain-containing protein [Porphyromonas pogonae]
MTKKIFYSFFIACACILLAPVSSWAQTSGAKLSTLEHELFPKALSPIHRITALGAGGSYVKDTYLSPMNYGGYHLKLQTEVYKNLIVNNSLLAKMLNKEPRAVKNWIRSTSFELDFSKTQNPAKNSDAYYVMAGLDLGYLYKLRLGSTANIFIGPNVRGSLGGIYNSRNGNNPGTLKSFNDLNAHVMLTYRVNSASFPVLFRLSNKINLMGAAFSQEFGESYYEHFLIDNKRSGIYFTHLGNTVSNRLNFQVEIPVFDYKTIVIGYQWNSLSNNINNIRTKINSHCLMLGVSTDILPIIGRNNLLNYISDRLF